MYKLSVVIITFNEERNIARCIESVKPVADEIIVLDSFSTDKTVAIAKSCGAVVFQEKFRGYIGQKNAAIELASHDYILSLDADEALDEQLIASVLEARKNFHSRAYSMNRCTCYCGHFIKHGLWYPDKKIRLFDRRVSHWGGLNPHDKVVVAEVFPITHLKGNILHYSFNTTEDLVWQHNRMSSIAAASLYTAGKRSNWFKMLVRPAWAFLNGFFFRRGFLDGIDGFTIAVNTSHQVFLKYSKLFRLQKTNHRTVKDLVIKPPESELLSAFSEK
ncbi:MAG: glycosyltransferase family 2 protein [Sphingobacteriales bacterium]|nr:glycosyltransferase family 2 protein [Sphingobacteriales bacterium]